MASVRWFIAYRFLGACLPYLPVASLCLAGRGLSWPEVLQLGALYTIASATLVLPISAVAQRLGPRRTLIGGAIAVAIGAVIAACGHGVATMALAQVAFAVAAAVDAGADSAYLWAALGHDREAYRRAEARSTAGKLAGGVVGIALGGVLVTWSPAAPFAAAAVFAVAAAVCAARLEEVTLPSTGASSLPAAAGALMLAVGGHRWLLIGIVSCAVARVMASAIGPLLADVGLTAGTASAVATGAALVAAVAAGLTGMLRGSWRRLALFAGAPAVLAVCAVALASAHGVTAAVIVAVLPVIAAVLGPLWRAHLNQQAPATAPRLLMLAVDATVVRVMAAVLQLVVTGAAPRAGIAGLGIALIVVMLAVAAAVMLRDRRIRFAVITIAALTLPQIAGADPDHAWATEAPALCTDAIAIDKPLGMGSTIKYKAHVGTTRVVVRPAQIRDAGNFRADVAAHRLATALGLETVPYGCIRRLDRATLEAVSGDALRARLATEVTWADDATVAVSVVAWVDGVTSADLDATRAVWRELLAQATPMSTDDGVIAAAAEGSRLAVWDFLIANWDRWSGGNTFRLGADDFVWLDNAAGFGRELARTRNARAHAMRTTERFSRGLIDGLRGLDDATLTAALADAGLAAGRIDEVIARRDLILAHVDALIASHGEDAVLVFE